MNTQQQLAQQHAELILNALPHVGPITFSKLISAFGSAEAILEASPDDLYAVEGVGNTLVNILTQRDKHFDLAAELGKMQSVDAHFVSSLDNDEYPKELREIYDPPIGLYVRGDIASQKRRVAIVGSRRSTLYGRSVAKKLAYDLAGRGFSIVSGLARGIDSAAHEGALEAGGHTIAVLGCGVDVIYPPENQELYHAIAKNGAVASEFLMGKKADKMTFPRRNRIVSGMSDIIIVVETASNGGSMITARLALEQGRTVMAVPGRIDQASSLGCHELLRDGAVLCRGAEDVLEELNYGGQLQLDLDGQIKKPEGLSATQGRIWEFLLEGQASGPDEICDELELDINLVASELMMLEIQGAVAKRADGRFEAK